MGRVVTGEICTPLTPDLTRLLNRSQCVVLLTSSVRTFGAEKEEESREREGTGPKELRNLIVLPLSLWDSATRSPRSLVLGLSERRCGIRVGRHTDGGRPSTGPAGRGRSDKRRDDSCRRKNPPTWGTSYECRIPDPCQPRGDIGNGRRHG